MELSSHFQSSFCRMCSCGSDKLRVENNSSGKGWRKIRRENLQERNSYPRRERLWALLTPRWVWAGMIFRWSCREGLNFPACCHRRRIRSHRRIRCSSERRPMRWSRARFLAALPCFCSAESTIRSACSENFPKLYWHIWTFCLKCDHKIIRLMPESNAMLVYWTPVLYSKNLNSFCYLCDSWLCAKWHTSSCYE